MAKVTGPAGSGIHGKIGPLTYVMKGNEQLVMQSPDFGKRVIRTEDQADVRVRISALAKAFKAFGHQLDFTYAKDKPTQNTYALFLKNNMPDSRIYITKEESKQGYQILDNFVVSSGEQLKTIRCVEKDNEVVSDICLGSLAIGENTTVKDFSLAVAGNNGGRFRNHHRIYFLRAVQYPALNNYPPTINVTSYSLTLDEFDANNLNTKLYEVVGKDAFKSVQALDIDGNTHNYLGADKTANSLVAWVHCMDTEGYHTVCSTQRLFGTPPFLQQYSGMTARNRAIDSWGITMENVASPNSPNSDVATMGPELSLTQDASDPSGIPSTPSTPSNPDTPAAQVVIATAVSPAGAGTVSGGGTYDRGAVVTLTATASEPEVKPFTRWSDGVTANPRTVTATQSATYTAVFGTESGGGGGMGEGR